MLGNSLANQAENLSKELSDTLNVSNLVSGVVGYPGSAGLMPGKYLSPGTYLLPTPVGSASKERDPDILSMELRFLEYKLLVEADIKSLKDELYCRAEYEHELIENINILRGGPLNIRKRILLMLFKWFMKK